MQSFIIASRIIKSVQYERLGGYLRVVFKNGDEREYVGVPEADVVAMCRAESPGQHYVTHISGRFERVVSSP